MTDQIKKRTKQIGLDVIALIDEIPQKPSGRAVTNQIVRSGTSIGANYRAACRAKSPKDFINKLKIVEEEADETLYWLEILEESKMLEKIRLSKLKQETNEILAIIVASIKTSRKSQRDRNY